MNLKNFEANNDNNSLLLLNSLYVRSFFPNINDKKFLFSFHLSVRYFSIFSADFSDLLCYLSIDLYACVLSVFSCTSFRKICKKSFVGATIVNFVYNRAFVATCTLVCVCSVVRYDESTSCLLFIHIV